MNLKNLGSDNFRFNAGYSVFQSLGTVRNAIPRFSAKAIVFGLMSTAAIMARVRVKSKGSSGLYG